MKAGGAEDLAPVVEPSSELAQQPPSVAAVSATLVPHSLPAQASSASVVVKKEVDYSDPSDPLYEVTLLIC